MAKLRQAVVAWGPSIGLLAVVLASVSLASVWVWRVPIFQAPDEPLHFDYALCLAEKGGLFRSTPDREAELANLAPAPLYASYEIPGYYLHPYTQLLNRETQTDSIAFNPAAKVRPDYGTPEYYERIDRQAPDPQSIRIRMRPSLMDCYPFGYYAVLAAWIELLRHCGQGVVGLFFGSRMLSVLFLAANLTVTYCLLRELGHRTRFALFVTLAVGCFPLTTFVSSYLQPDNLSFLLVSTSFYLALRVRRRATGGLIGLLGLSLGVLSVTKLHYFACVAMPVALMLASEAMLRPELRRKLLRHLPLLFLPALVLGAVHVRSTWYVKNYYAAPAEQTDVIIHTIRWLKMALVDFYLTVTHDSFFGIFGWMDAPLVIRGPRTHFVVQFLLHGVTLASIGLTLLRLEQVASRLVRITRRGRPWQALRIACSNPVLNGYFLFTAMMIALYVLLENRFHAQGRNWLPFLLPTFLTLLVYAPKALSGRPLQRISSAALAAGLAIYCAVGSYYGLQTIERRYYAATHHQRVQEMPLPLSLIAAHQITASGPVAVANGADPYLIYRLPQPQHVHAIQLKISLDRARPGAAQFQVWWMRTGANNFSPNERNSIFRLPVGSHEQTLTVWVNDTIDQLRIDPDVDACQFQLREAVLLRPD